MVILPIIAAGSVSDLADGRARCATDHCVAGHSSLAPVGGNIGSGPEGYDAMTYVDSAVLGLTERICRRFQAWTGRTNVWVAFQLTNLSIVVYFIWVTRLYFMSGDIILRVFVALFCGAVFFVLTRTIFKTSIELFETEAYRRVATGLRNPRRIRDAQLRIAFLTLSIMLSYPLWLAFVRLHVSFALFTEALVILTTVVLYVLACDPLPPCAGKVREWLRRLAPARSAKAQPAGSSLGAHALLGRRAA
jgi:hypothetical protein